GSLGEKYAQKAAEVLTSIIP
nr:RecName: Full=Venom peptide Ocy8 [Opisthacanthus cayaporum]